MTQVFNVYCDESCHLEKDCQKAMVLGAVWCPLERTRQISVRIREIKVDHGLPPGFEIKWVKVSPAKVQFYVDVMGYFFDDDDLHFRALIAPDKSKLRHDVYSQTHDDWYYKMYFDMLKVILQPDARYRIYLDYKDTQGAAKVAKLHDVLCNNMYDFSREIIERVQLVRSHEVEILQLADLLIGTVSYVNRGLSASAAKTCLVDRMRERSGYALTRTTLLREDKVNLFRWRATEIGE
ncbi:MAG TPA: DUF3800 domain-containing protein [Anaerolineae bacterium]|nr:DUF3800 domain-containing protein [Anaerolineae bacterium]